MSTAAEKKDPIQSDAEEALYDWLSNFGAMGEMKVALHRRHPKKYKGVQVAGLIQNYEEPVSQEDVQSEHGGGKYQIVVQQKKPNKNGNPQWKYAGARTFEIAGPPRVDPLLHAEDEDDDEAAPPTHGDGPVGQAMNMMARMAERAEDRAARAEGRGGGDIEMMRLMLAPLQAQVAELTTQLAAKDQQVISLISKPADNTVQDRVLGLMESKEVAHGNAIETIRANHDSEMRQLRDFNREEIRRREDRFMGELAARDAAHAREVETLRTATAQAMDSQRLGFEMRIDGLKETIKRLEREVSSKDTELTTLRAQKQQGPLEQIQNLVTLKQGMEALVPTGSDEPTKSGWERAAETIMNSPLAEGVAARLAGAAGGPPQEEMVQVRAPDGRIVQVPASYIAQMQAQRAAAAAQMEEAEGAQQEAGPQLDDADVARAVQFVEAAYRNGTDAETFARSARHMIPAGILAYLKQVGVDPFLNNVAKLEDGSPLATVQGRMYVRRVAKFLLEGTTEIMEDDLVDLPLDDEPTSPVESS